jgi:hypothetical protein
MYTILTLPRAWFHALRMATRRTRARHGLLLVVVERQAKVGHLEHAAVKQDVLGLDVPAHGGGCGGAGC